MIRDRVQELIRVPAKDLIPDARNPRKHPPEQVSALRSALGAVGFADVAIARRTDDGALVLIDGHARQGAVDPEQMVPVIILDVDEAEAGLLLATLDPLAAMAKEDAGALSSLIATLNTEDADTAALLHTLSGRPTRPKTIYGDPGNVPDDASRRVEPGEVWAMGNHRIMCGDSTSAVDAARLMGDNTASLVFTSPPYADARDYRGAGSLDEAHLSSFLRIYAVYADLQAVNLGVIRKDYALVLYWNAYIDAAAAAGLKFLSWNVWDKGRPHSVSQMIAMFPIEHEFVFVFGRNHRELNLTIPNINAGTSFKQRIREPDGLFKVEGVGRIRDARPLGTVFRSEPFQQDIGHPAVFPVALPEAYITAATQEGDIVIDPFLGAGTTLISCEEQNRVCYGMELETKYCDITLARWEAFTGAHAERISPAP